MQQYIKLIINRIHNTERYSESNREAWADLFREAKAVANQLKTSTKYACTTTKNNDITYRKRHFVPRDNDEIMVRQIVDNWMAYDNTAYIQHSHPNDNNVADDKSCMRSLVEQKREFCNDILREIIQTNCPKTRTRLWNLYDDEIRTELSSADFAVYSEFQDATQFCTHQEQTDNDKCINHNMYKESIHQDTECDPDDERYIGTPPRRDMDGHITYDSKMQSNFVDRGRGAEGVLNGLYTNSYPEPTFRTKDQKRLLRSTLLASDNIDDVKLATYMTPMSHTRRKNLLRKRIQKLERV